MSSTADVRLAKTGIPGLLAKTGIPGLDVVLGGGLPRGRLYLIQGAPGTGKTTVGLRFLLEGLSGGERCLYVSLSETEEELREVARSHGWDLSGLAIYEPIQRDSFGTDDDNTLFHPAEVELAETTKALLTEIKRLSPERIVIDSLSQIQLLSGTQARYRRQITALRDFFAGRESTALLLEEASEDRAAPVQSLVYGMIRIENAAPLYGPERRRVIVQKVRGAKFHGGYHDFKIETGCVSVFPRLVAAEHHEKFDPEPVSSEIPELDQALGGGLERGTTTLILGPAGTGKSMLAAQVAGAASRRGERTALFFFDEGLETVFARFRALGFPLESQVEAGGITLQQIDPAEMTPGEFANRVQNSVERDGARVVVVDSLNGYLHAMPDHHALALHLHELFSYLRQRGVLILLTVAQHGLVSAPLEAPFDVSYLADTVILLRYFETAGRVYKAFSVIKKRSGSHENVLRELAMSDRGLRVGGPLRGFRGVVFGSPVYTGPTSPLLSAPDDDNS